MAGWDSETGTGKERDARGKGKADFFNLPLEDPRKVSPRHLSHFLLLILQSALIVFIFMYLIKYAKLIIN